MYYLAKMMDPRDRGSDLSGLEKMAAYRLLQDRILKNPVFAPNAQKVCFENFIILIHILKIIVEYAHFKEKTGPFGHPDMKTAWDVLATTDMDARTWWGLFFGDSLLAPIHAITTVVPLTSSANERDFSRRGFIHSKIRNR